MLTIKGIILSFMLSNPAGLPMEDVSFDELKCMADNMYFEAAGEPTQGRVAVGNVVKNRVKDSRYRDTYCGVIKRGKKDANGNMIKDKCTFSWYCDGKPDVVPLYNEKGELLVLNRDAYIEILLLSLMIMTDHIEDNTDGATHYYNPFKVTPYWKKFYTYVDMIGNHVFYRREKGSLK